MGTSVLPPPALGTLHSDAQLAQQSLCSVRQADAGAAARPWARQAKGLCGAQPDSLWILLNVPASRVEEGEVGAAASLPVAVSLSLVSPAEADQGQSRKPKP